MRSANAAHGAKPTRSTARPVGGVGQRGARMSRELLLFLHLSGVMLFAGGSAVATVLRVTAIRRRTASEVALLLGAVRPVVPLVAGGFVLALAAGFALAGKDDVDLGDPWLTISFALIGYLLVVGAIAGRSDRHTRELAEQQARDAGGVSQELASRLRDPVTLTLNASMLAATFVIVGLMVWQPGRF